MKIDTTKVVDILKAYPALTAADLRRIVEEMNNLVQTAQDEGEGDKEPPVKKQFVVLVSDKDGLLKGNDFVAWVLQIEEGESPATTEDRILRGAYEFNASKRGHLLPVTTIGDALENVGAKYLKNAGVWAKTKTPVLVVRTNNQIPTE
jgi:hypothetical protein